MTAQPHSCRASLPAALVVLALAQLAACTPYYTRRAYVYRPAPDAHAGERHVHAPHAYGSGYYYDPYAAHDDGDDRGEPRSRAHPATHRAAPERADVPRPQERR